MVSSESLWLSSLTQSNDAMEGRLVAEAITRLARCDGLSEQFVGQIQTQVGWFDKIVTGLGFCLSEESDLLSQWRGYAADATGFSVGFRRQYLEQLGAETITGNRSGFALRKVAYMEEDHDREVAPAYEETKRFIQSGAFKPTGRRGLLDSRSDEEIEREDEPVRAATNNASLAIFTLLPSLYLLKSRAFREEQEWRLLTHLTNSDNDTCLYRCTATQIVPYRIYPLLDIVRQPIAEVVIGPKNPTPIHVVRDFFSRTGYGKVDVRRSEATYR